MIWFKGDLSGDGKITAEDAAILEAHLLSGFPLTSRQMIVADINGDGVVNSIDSLLIQQHIKGINVINEYIEGVE